MRLQNHRHLDRIVRAAGTPEILAALTERLAPTDLQTLLLETYRRRAARISPGMLLQRYEADRFTAPSGMDALELARLELLALERPAGHGFEGLTLSPVCPLGTSSAIATVDQNKVVTTARNTEVVSDPSNVLALECAVRRRTLLRADHRCGRRVKLAATHRVVRAQAVTGCGLVPHFSMLALCTAGRDEGSFRFETTALAEQLAAHLDVLRSVTALGPRVSSVRVGAPRAAGRRLQHRGCRHRPSAAGGHRP